MRWTRKPSSGSMTLALGRKSHIRGRHAFEKIWGVTRQLLLPATANVRHDAMYLLQKQHRAAQAEDQFIEPIEQANAGKQRQSQAPPGVGVQAGSGKGTNKCRQPMARDATGLLSGCL